MVILMNSAVAARERFIKSISNVEAFIVCFCLALMTGGLSKGLTGGNAVATDRIGGDVSVGIVLLYVPAYCYALWAIYKSPFIFMARLKRVGPLWVPIIFCAVSILWSLSPEATGRRVALLIIGALFSVALSARLGREGLIKVVGIVTVFVVVVQFATAIVLPDIGMPHNKFYPAISGLFTQKNNAGRALLIGVIAGLALLNSRPRTMGWIVLIFSALGVVASLSGTAIVAMIVCIAIYYALISLRSTGLLYLATVAGVIGVIVILVALGTTVTATDDTFSIMGKSATLSGRTNIWSALWRAIGTGYHWWWGFGYEAFFASPEGAGSLNWNMGKYHPPHSHNGMLQTWVNIGVVGVIITASSMIFILIRACRNFAVSADRLSMFDIIMMFYFILVNITEQTTLAYNNYIWGIFVAVAALPAAAASKASTPPRVRGNHPNYPARVSGESGQRKRDVFDAFH